MQLPYLEHVDRLAAAADRFALVVEAADPQTPVPSCPGWSLAELTAHLTEIQRWALAELTDAEPPRLDPSLSAIARFRLGAAELVGALRERPADAPCRAIYPPELAATWARRQALELAIHLWDAENAVGAAAPVEPALALDGIAEVIDDMYPRQVRLGRQEPLAATVDFAVTDAAARLTLAGSGAEPAAPDAVLTGAASELFLLLWGRRELSAGGVKVEGDADAVRTMLSARLVP